MQVIYNGGNPILFWAGIPALAACAVLAWKRRSMALVLIVAAFAFQYVPWIRIERADFYRLVRSKFRLADPAATDAAGRAGPDPGDDAGLGVGQPG